MRIHRVVLGYLALALLLGCNGGVPSDVWNSESAHAIAAREAALAAASDPSSPSHQADTENSNGERNAARSPSDGAVEEVSVIESLAVEGPYTTWTLSETSANSLVRLGPASLPLLEVELGTGDVQQQRRAAATLARMGPDATARVETVELLVNTLADENADPLVRRLCARAIGQIGPAIWPLQPQPYRPATTLASIPSTNAIPMPLAESGEEIVAARVDGVEVEQRLRVDYDPTSKRFREYEAAVRDYNRRLEIAQQAVDLLAELTLADAGGNISLGSQ